MLLLWRVSLILLLKVLLELTIRAMPVRNMDVVQITATLAVFVDPKETGKIFIDTKKLNQ